MPATEARKGAAEEAEEQDSADEFARYECAFHILPTVAEEEVPALMERVKSFIERTGGAVNEEESAGHVDLAYEIVKEVGGERRRFNAAHFCWVRFTLAPSALASLAEEVGRLPEGLRYLIIRLTMDEAHRPFFVRAARGAYLSGGAAAPEGGTDIAEQDAETVPEDASSNDEAAAGSGA